MRLTFSICLLCVLQSFAIGTFSQNARLSINQKNVSIESVLQLIEDKTDYYFMYSALVVDVKRTVDIGATNKLVPEILEDIFKGTDTSFKIDGRLIALSRNDEISPVSQQQKSISGKVTDSSGGPLPGVSVLVKGTTTGVITGMDGKYAIAKVPENATLLFSFVGMKTQEIASEGKTTVNVSLSEESIGIDEVVAVGYGTANKATLTGSISSVKGEKIQASPAINITNSLTGMLPGLIAINGSGEPGYDGALLRIRGSNTLGDNSPLIVIDGVINRSLDGINSQDIESISVLKDASAAIYGSQAANGVILITTKRGIEGKAKVSITLNQGWNKPTILPKMADAATYAQLVNEILLSRSLPAQYSSDQIQKFKDGNDPWLYPNTDWFAELYKSYSKQNNVNILLSGGSDLLKYFVSAGYKYVDGNFKNSASDYSQADFRSNIDWNLANNIKLSFDISGRQENRNSIPVSTSYIYEMAMLSYPTMTAYWPNGLPGPDVRSGLNPVVIATNAVGFRKSISYIMQSNVKLNIDIPWVKGLSVQANVSIDKNFQNDKSWQTPWYLYSWDRITYDANNVPFLNKGIKGVPEPRLSQSMSDGHNTTLNALINYEHSFNDRHNIKVLAGMESIKGESMYFSAYRRYFISTMIPELFAGGDLEKDNNGSASAFARLNYFSRINYNYQQKYLAEFLFRYDGSYIFPAKDRFGFFPGISLGWRISEEGFWKNKISIINDFKIRGSWGQTGNDRIEEYQYLASYAFNRSFILNTNVENKTITEQKVPNPNVTWEVANQTNIGFDAILLGNKLTLSGDYFYNFRNKILWWRNASVPKLTGLSLPRENIGEVVNQGFEFVIGHNGIIGDFNYQVTLNSAYQRNRIHFWDETPGVPEYQKSTGQIMNAALYYQAIGIFKDQAAVDAYPHWSGARPGDIIFKDVNTDGKIDGLDRVRDDKSGLPKFTGGMNINLTYKNFYTAILFNWATGAQMYKTDQSGLFGNFLQEDAIGRWTEDNPNASKPRVWNDGGRPYWKSNINTYWLRSTDYLRFKNIELGYNLPGKINTKLGIEGLRIYFSVQNLLTITNLRDFDPEGAYGFPPLKIFTSGISLNF